MSRHPARILDKTSISIVIPVKNEEACVAEVVQRLRATLTPLDADFEIIFVDDGSTDGTAAAIRALATDDDRIKGVRLSRNRGHQIALACGLKLATGDVVITMDADLQHPPELLPRMLELWRDGVDIVNTSRRDHVDASRLQISVGRTFYRLFNRLADLELVPGGADFRLLDRRCVEALNAMGEYYKFFRGQVPYIGFRQQTLAFDCAPRFAGRRSYSLRQSFQLATSGLFGYSTVGLKVPIYIGSTALIVALAYLAAILLRTMLGQPVLHPGWMSAIVLLVIILAVNMLYLGIIGLYVSKVFVEVKRRPLYFVEETLGRWHDIAISSDARTTSVGTSQRAGAKGGRPLAASHAVLD